MAQTAISAQPNTAILTLQLPESMTLHVTAAQFATLAAVNRELRLERTATGALIVNPPTGGDTGYRNWSISGELYLWWRNAQEPGRAFDSSTGFELPNGANRSPDAAWVCQERLDALTPEETAGFIPLCPDFAVELRPKTDTLKALRAKLQEYIQNGTQLGWLIDPKNKRVEIYRPGQVVEVLENPQVLSGEKILLGFNFSLERIWD